jgi:hypothetical protein
MRIEAQSIVTKLLATRITIKKEELGLSKKQFIKNRASARKKNREKANEKKWEDMKATMDRIHEDVLRSRTCGSAPPLKLEASPVNENN